jgi:hypothetical protein
MKARSWRKQCLNQSESFLNAGKLCFDAVIHNLGWINEPPGWIDRDTSGGGTIAAWIKPALVWTVKNFDSAFAVATFAHGGFGFGAFDEPAPVTHAAEL